MNTKKFIALAVTLLMLTAGIAWSVENAELILTGTIPIEIMVRLAGIDSEGETQTSDFAINGDGTFDDVVTGLYLEHYSNTDGFDVSVTSENQDGGVHRMEYNGYFIPYILDIGGEQFGYGADIITGGTETAGGWEASAGADGAITIKDDGGEAGLIAGDYTDTLTFTITGP